MPRIQHGNLVPIDLEIEKTFRRRRRGKNQQNQTLNQNMADQPPPPPATTVGIADDKDRRIRDYATPEFDQLNSGIIRPNIVAPTFKPEPVMFQMIQAMGQFGGLPSEDPHSHLRSFIEMTDHFRIAGVTTEALRLTLFTYTLRDRAKAWLTSQPPGSIDTWANLAEKFLKKYFPPTRNVKLRNDIMSFRQEDDEAVSDAWERFKDLIRKCPHHGIPHCIQLETFYNGLSNAAKIILDATAGGAFVSKTYNEGFDILEKVANNNTEWSNPRAIVPKNASGIHELDAISALNAQIVALTNLVKNNLNINQVQPESCAFCGEGHVYDNCPGNPVSVNYVGNNSRNSPFSQTYNPNWRNHPNFSWSGNQGLQPPGVSPTPHRAPNPPGFHHNASSSHGGQPPQMPPYRPHNGPENNNSLESMLKGFINQTNATLRGFETQLGQFAADLKGRQVGNLPSDTETPKGNHTEHIKAMTLRSGVNEKENTFLPNNDVLVDALVQEEAPHSFDRSNFSGLFSPTMAAKWPLPSPLPDQTAADSAPSVLKTAPGSGDRSGDTVATSTNKKVDVNQPKLDLRDLPFPGRMKNKNVDNHFKKFLDIFKQLHINIPLVEALEQMPSYVKFLKDILNKKRRLSEFETVALTKETSDLLTCKIPPKVKDPGSFTIPCSIGGKKVGHALCDLGASINLMPLSIFKKLGIGEARPTTVILQLADRSVVYPKGKIEDVLVQVDKFIFPADFLVLDYEADKNVPIILGRPFLATGRTLIDVEKGELTMRVNDQQVTFNVFNSLKFHGEVEDCSAINLLSEDLGVGIEMYNEKFEDESGDELEFESQKEMQPPIGGKPCLKEVRLNHHKHKKKQFLWNGVLSSSKPSC